MKILEAGIVVLDTAGYNVKSSDFLVSKNDDDLIEMTLILDRKMNFSEEQKSSLDKILWCWTEKDLPDGSWCIWLYGVFLSIKYDTEK